ETIINKCLSGKVTGNDQLRLPLGLKSFRACIIKRMLTMSTFYGEDLVYQIKNKVSKKNTDMYYLRFTKLIINHFMSKDQSIPRRNKVDWHMAKDDPILTTIRFIPKHETIQKYGAILPDTLTNQAMKESDAYKTYYDLATGKVILKPKYTLSETTLSEAEQMKVSTKRSKTDYHVSHTSCSGAREGTGVTLEVPNVPTYGFEDEQISWKSSDDENDDEVSKNADNEDDDDHDDEANTEDDDGQDDDNEQTKLDNDGDDFVHPKLSTSNQRFHTPSHFDSTDDEAYDKVTQGDNVEEEKLDEEKTNKEEEVNELYNDVNINLKERDIEMIDNLLANVQATQVIEDTYVIMTVVTPKVQQQSSLVSSGFISKMFNPNPYTGIDSILNLNTESTSLADVPVTTNDEILPSSSVSEQLEAEVLIRSSNKAKTSHTVAANLSELELKKILIDKMENNKSIDRSVQYETLYKALVDAYESDNDILATYKDTVTLKRRRDDEDDDEEPSTGSNRGSKRRRARKEPESSSEPKEKSSKSTGKSNKGKKSHQKSTG
nr:hypothetical protein [Tanacetum cinerariifolium]